MLRKWLTHPCASPLHCGGRDGVGSGPQWPADTGLDAETQGHERQFAPVDRAARPADRAQVCCFSRLFTIGWHRGSVLAD